MCKNCAELNNVATKDVCAESLPRRVKYPRTFCGRVTGKQKQASVLSQNVKCESAPLSNEKFMLLRGALLE